jgi:predicted nucleotidyltransferase
LLYSYFFFKITGINRGRISLITEETLKKAAQRLADNFHPKKIILFGSQAKGMADKHSDVDLLVICSIKGNRRDLMVAMDRALRGLGFARDIIVLTPEEFERDRYIPGTVARPAWQEGKVIYESS